MNEEYIICPNPNFLERRQIEELIKNNDGYCISKVNKNDENKCICKEFNEQNQSGWCHCKRYYKILRTSKICLCGDCDQDELLQISHDLALEGYITTISTSLINNDNPAYFEELHKAEIAEADLIYIITKNDQIDPMIRQDIEWAEQLRKKIIYIDCCKK